MASNYVTTLTLSVVDRGKVIEYATQQEADACIARFGKALSVENVEDAYSRGVRVTCATQRGPGGSFRMHAYACAANIPVVCD